MTITLKEATLKFLDYLKQQGKAERTLYTYGKDLEQIRAYFGEEKVLSKILIPHVCGFLKSDALLMKESKDGQVKRAQPTVGKTIRVLKQLMIWAVDNGFIERLALPRELNGQIKGKMDVEVNT